VRIPLVFERNTSANHSFHGGNRLGLLQIGLYSCAEATHIPSKKTMYVF
jgi:hypothetical protein